MAFFDKLQAVAKTVGDTASDTVESAKLKTKMNGEKREISELLEKIGQVIFDQAEAGNPPEDEGLRSMIYQIKEHQKTIADLEQQVADLKND